MATFPVIDADAHVIETERTWDYLEPSEQKFRPLLYSSPQDPARQYWVIEEKIRGFVTCQTNDDINYILRYAGGRSLVIGTDYGHTDPSSEVDAITAFRMNQEISQEIKERTLFHNPRVLYSL